MSRKVSFFWNQIYRVLRSYRFRLFLAFLVVMIVSLGLYLGIVLGQLHNYTLQVQSNLLQSRLEFWAYTLDFESSPLPSETQEVLHTGSKEYHVAVMVIHDHGKSRFIALDGYRPPDNEMRRIWAALEKRLQITSPVTFQNENLVVVAVPQLNRQTKALIAAATPVYIGWRHLIDSIVQVALVGLIGSALLAWLLARSVSRPVARLTQAARRVAQGVYDDPPLPRSDSEIGQLVSTFDKMREQVSQALQIQRDFLTGVSHDLKTPLSIIKGYVSALEDGVADDADKRRRSFEGIRREADRMGEFIATLLELARLEAGLTPFDPQPVDLSVIARKVINAFTVPAQEMNIRFQDRLPPSLPQALADERQIERVITNLVDNALKYSEPEGSILIGGESRSDRNCLWIDDRGPGIPPEAMERIFEKFFRLDSVQVGSKKGSGFGLAIAREIMLRHKGKIWVENLPGKGARFTICLPIS